MRKYVLVTVFIFTVLLTQAQYSEERKVGDFDEISAHGKVTVELIPAEENKVVVESDEDVLEYVNTDHEGQKLKITLKKNNFKEQGTIVKIYYVRLRELHAYAGATIIADEEIKGDKLQVTVNAGDKINIRVDVKKIELKVASGGKIDVIGKTSFQDASVSAGGIIESRSLKCSRAIAKVKAGGEIFIWAIDELEAKVSAGGTVHYKGNPKTLDKSVTLGGSVRKVSF